MAKTVRGPLPDGGAAAESVWLASPQLVSSQALPKRDIAPSKAPPAERTIFTVCVRYGKAVGHYVRNRKDDFAGAMTFLSATRNVAPEREESCDSRASVHRGTPCGGKHSGPLSHSSNDDILIRHVRIRLGIILTTFTFLTRTGRRVGKR